MSRLTTLRCAGRLFVVLAILAVFGCEEEKYGEAGGAEVATEQAAVETVEPKKKKSKKDDDPEDVPPAVVAPLQIEPEFATAADDGDLVVFKASGGVPPYTWLVVDGATGHIIDDEGTSTLYQRIRGGDDNGIRVTDSVGEQAYAVIDQP